jgi:DNA invertase Pin-like site-specific DNA recombinase/uncharacterized coiled-coil protein SlyX
MDDRLNGNGAYYIRVSTDRQDTQRQQDTVNQWLASHEVKIGPQFRFEDDGFERDRPDLRPEFQRMMKCAESKLIQWIIVDAQDRFGTRDKHQFIHFMYLLREFGWHLFTVAGKCLTDDSIVAFFEGGLGADTSEKEQREKSHRILTGKLPRAKRGEWQGGHIAYGTDVVCFGPDNKERWRVVIDGRKLAGTKQGRNGKPKRIYSTLRMKVFPNGKSIAFEGDNNFPARESDERLELRPSKDKGRLAVVREVFSKYAAEAVSPSKLATYLNTLGVKHYYAESWAHFHVREMLKNPIYIGYQRWNSNGQGRFHEFIGGKESQVTDTHGRRERLKEDWVLSERQLFKPMISMEIWEATQGKIERNPPKRRDPKSADLWLTGLLFCSHCGQPMRGMKRPTRCEYFCGSYASNGTNKECLRHCINHKVAEEYIQKYLKESGREAEVLLKAQETGHLDLLQPYHEKHRSSLMRFCFALGRTVDVVLKHSDWEDVLRQCGAKASKKKPPQNLEELHADMTAQFLPLQKAYQLYFQRDEAVARQHLIELEHEHTALTNRMLNFDPATAQRAIQKTNSKIAELEQEIERVDGKLKNWADELGKVREETYSHVTALDATEEILNDRKSENRRKAQAVRSCIDRINLTFRPTGKKYPKSELVGMEIIPNTSHGPEYSNGASH